MDYEHIEPVCVHKGEHVFIVGLAPSRFSMKGALRKALSVSPDCYLPLVDPGRHTFCPVHPSFHLDPFSNEECSGHPCPRPVPSTVLESPISPPSTSASRITLILLYLKESGKGDRFIFGLVEAKKTTSHSFLTLRFLCEILSKVRENKEVAMKATAMINPEDYILSVLSPEDRLEAALKISRETFKNRRLTVGDIDRAVRKVRRKAYEGIQR